MQWTDTALILSTRKHGETSAIARLLTANNGMAAGVIRAAQSKKIRGIAQSGNIISAHWQARLPEQLGTLSCELITPHAALIMSDASALSALTSACTIVESALPEHHPYPRLFKSLSSFLARLHTPDWEADYVAFELMLLAESGFGLDLSVCAATGETEDLIYVSPKSGRAVSRAAGRPYHDKLLPLPPFLHTTQAPTPQDIFDGLTLTGYFLDHWLLAPHSRKLPASRARLLQQIPQPELYKA